MKRIIHLTAGLALPLILRKVASIRAPVRAIKRDRWTPEKMRLARPEKLSAAVISRQRAFHTISRSWMTGKGQASWQAMDLVLPNGAASETPNTTPQASASNLLKTLLARQSGLPQSLPEAKPASPVPQKPNWKRPEPNARVFRKIEEFHPEPTRPATRPGPLEQAPVSGEPVRSPLPVEPAQPQPVSTPPTRVFRRAWKEELPGSQTPEVEDVEAEIFSPISSTQPPPLDQTVAAEMELPGEDRTPEAEVEFPGGDQPVGQDTSMPAAPAPEMPPKTSLPLRRRPANPPKPESNPGQPIRRSAHSEAANVKPGQPAATGAARGSPTSSSITAPPQEISSFTAPTQEIDGTAPLPEAAESSLQTTPAGAASAGTDHPQPGLTVPGEKPLSMPIAPGKGLSRETEQPQPVPLDSEINRSIPTREIANLPRESTDFPRESVVSPQENVGFPRMQTVEAAPSPRESSPRPPDAPGPMEHHAQGSAGPPGEAQRTGLPPENVPPAAQREEGPAIREDHEDLQPVPQELTPGQDLIPGVPAAPALVSRKTGILAQISSEQVSPEETILSEPIRPAAALAPEPRPAGEPSGTSPAGERRKAAPRPAVDLPAVLRKVEAASGADISEAKSTSFAPQISGPTGLTHAGTAQPPQGKDGLTAPQIRTAADRPASSSPEQPARPAGPSVLFRTADSSSIGRIPTSDLDREPSSPLNRAAQELPGRLGQPSIAAVSEQASEKRPPGIAAVPKQTVEGHPPGLILRKFQPLVAEKAEKIESVSPALSSTLSTGDLETGTLQTGALESIPVRSTHPPIAPLQAAPETAETELPELQSAPAPLPVAGIRPRLRRETLVSRIVSRSKTTPPAATMRSLAGDHPAAPAVSGPTLKPYPAPSQALLGGQAISPAIESTRLSPEAASGQAVVENAILGSMTMSRPGGSSPEERGLAWPEWQVPDKVREGELVLRRRTGVQSEARLSEQDEHAPDGPDLSLAQTQPAAVRLSLANPPTPALSEAKVQREATDVSDVPEEQMHEGEPESPTLPGVTAAPDIKELARQVYPLIKRMLANERERAFGRRG